MKQYIIKTLVLFIIISLNACLYKVPKPEVLPPIEDTVSYSADVEPIFTDQTCTNCHTASNPLNLLPGVSYASIMSNDLVDTTDAENSRIYYYCLPTGTHFQRYTAEQANIVLAWINQGALDN